MKTQTHCCSFNQAVKLFISQLFINTTPHPTFLAVLFLTRIVLIFVLLVNVNQQYDLTTISQPIVLLILLPCLIYSIILVATIIYIVINMYIRSKKAGKLREQSYMYKMRQKLVVYSLVVFRVVLVIPIVFVCMSGIKLQQQQGANTYSPMVNALIVLNIILGFALIYLISGIGFWNKIGICQDGLTYCTAVNIQSLTYLFIPIVFILRIISPQVQSYIGIVYTILSLLVVYIYPIVSFNHNKLHSLSTSCVISLVFVMSVMRLVDGRMDNFGKFVIIVVAVVVGALAMWQGQMNRMRGLLVGEWRDAGDNNVGNNINNQQQQQPQSSQQQPNPNLTSSNISTANHNNYSMFNELDHQCYYQNLLYHLINWQQTQSQLVLYAISMLNYTNENKNSLQDRGNNVRGNNNKGLILSEIIKANAIDKKNQLKKKVVEGLPAPRTESKSSIGKVDTLKLGTTQSLKLSKPNIGDITKNNSTLKKPQQQKQQQQQQFQQSQQQHPLTTPTTLHQIMSTLSQQQVKLQKLYDQFCKLISTKLNTKCNLQMIQSQKLGIGELLKVLQQSTGYFILLLQSLMLDSRNFSKTYLLIKLQQQLFANAQTSSFIQSTYQLAIISIIESHFVQQFKTNHLTYSHAQVYFTFQQQYQKLKQYIKLSIENKLLFWKETNKQQPMKDKLENHVMKNYLLQTKIRKHTQRLTTAHPTSPLILISLIQAYTQLAMNTNMSSSKNSFNFLAVQFHKLTANMKGEKMKQSVLKNVTIMEGSGREQYSFRDNNSAKIDVPYSNQNESTPSRGSKISSIQQRNKQKQPQQNANKYSIQKNIGVILINLQTHQYPIQWANEYFLDNYTNHLCKTLQDNINNEQQTKYTSKKKKQLFLNDFIIPQLRAKHDTYMYEFIQKGGALGYKHPQTELYFPFDQTFADVNMQFQYVPTLSQGLKMVGFIHTIKSKQDVVEIIVRNDLSFVACTKSFMDHYEEYCMVRNHIDFEKDKDVAFQLIMQNNIFGDYFANLRMRQSSYGKKMKKHQLLQEKKGQQSWIETKINHLGMNYKVRLKKKVPYECKTIQGMKQTSATTNKLLFIFNLQTQPAEVIVQEKKKQQQQEQEQQKIKPTVIETKQQLQKKPHKKTILKKDSLEVTTEGIAIGHQKQKSIKFSQSVRSSLRGSLDTFNVKSSKGSLYSRGRPQAQQKAQNIMQDILIKQRQKIQDRPTEIVNLQRCYQILVSQKTPRNVKRWRIFTAIIIFLLTCAMILNMGLLTQRQQLYQTNNDLAVTYSELISDICSTILAVREYNYYVNVYNTSVEQVPFIVKKLVALSNSISIEVNLLAAQLRDTWQAYEILPTGQTVGVNDSSYVVISNYLLSSITFISQLSSTNMSFPILFSEIQSSQTMPTAAEVSFLQAVFNGLYVAIPCLLTNRQEFLASMTSTLQSISEFYFLYTCIGGSLCLMLLFALSLLLQLKSQKIRSKTGGLLSKQCLGAQQKRRKIYRLQRLDQILQKSRVTLLMHNLSEQQQRYKYMNVIASTLKDIEIEDTAHQAKSDMALNLMVNKDQHIIEDKTSREFMFKQESIRSNDFGSLDEGSEENTSKGMKKQNPNGLQVYVRQKSNPNNNYKAQNSGDTTLYQITYKDHLLLVTFYLIVCLPFFAYFIGILVGTISINSTIVNHITINSEVENRKTYQEIVYLFTRETAYYESFLEDQIGNWTQYVMRTINSAYANDRYVQSLIMSQATAVNLQSLLSQLNNNNLCQYISPFPTATYYNITFTQAQCLNLAKGIMSHGYKQLVVTFLQSSLQLINNYTNPSTLNNTQRIQYLQQPQIFQMKAILAYSEQFVTEMLTAGESDFQAQLSYLSEVSILLSVISILSLILFIAVVSYRYKKLRLQRRQVLSIINLISVQTISSSINNKEKSQNNKQNTQLLKSVQAIDWNFYQ